MATQLEHAQIEQVKRLTQTTDFLGQDIETLTEAAPGLFSQWIDFLQGQGLDEVADELEQLQGFVNANDGPAVSQSLQNLIGHLDTAAETAQGSVAIHLGELARALQQLEQRADGVSR